ncbi:hypothetical protein MUK70_15330 [Dyadobacter chenwenxiniae]|uniref:Membrane or secreted protein n=1 Tax=Dyadobacter chenwenxiniae TaxID=2906456 RepID=A0A9X1PGB4_9BACT|nr:hypothetical protein [Dyadobacter chenwenxiniae]MCF0060615.1 hypothetical protein [Dyadobacter chenwenxiniae]UON80447.1 hypothetical protein MUK70_15330 [Dyadobacter chenwenxiniae]
MKKLLVPFCLLLLAGFTAFRPVSKVDGVFIRSAYKFGDMKDWGKDDSLTVIKVLRDGFWMVAYYDDNRKGRASFNGLAGGTYEIANGKYVEHISFYSWDSTAAGKTFEFDFEVGDQSFEQHGKINSDKYKNYPIHEKFKRLQADTPLEDKRLEGIWKMTRGEWGEKGRFGEGIYKNMTTIKIYSYPIAIYAYYNEATKSFQGGGGVRYNFNGETLTETNEFWSWKPDGSRKGLLQTHQITFDKNKVTQKGWEGKLHEEYEKLK